MYATNPIERVNGEIKRRTEGDRRRKGGPARPLHDPGHHRTL